MKKPAFKISRPVLLPWLLGLLGLSVLNVIYIKVVHSLFLQITDQAGFFYLTFSRADLDLDGDLDVLVHNIRNPGEFEAYTGGTLWNNQGGLQVGKLDNSSNAGTI